MATDRQAALTVLSNLLASFDRQVAAVDSEENEGRSTFEKLLADCQTKRASIEEKRASVRTTILAIRNDYPDDDASDYNAPPLHNPDQVHSLWSKPQAAPKTRARIGDQRYKMFYILREQGAQSAEYIAGITALDIRRIKNQMSDDVTDGFVSQHPDERYELTEKGMHLMTRFESYRREAGKPLPSLDDPAGDDREEDVQTDEMKGVMSE